MKVVNGPTVEIRLAEPADLGELFSLQRAAFVDEAMLYGTPHVPALDESLDDFAQRHRESITFVAVEQRRLIAAVSLRRHDTASTETASTDTASPETLFDVERLMTAPDRRGGGAASALMAHIDNFLVAEGEKGVQLIVGDIAVGNRRLYERLGYTVESRWESVEFPGVFLVRMAKALGQG